jgi:hypothetical protein
MRRRNNLGCFCSSVDVFDPVETDRGYPVRQSVLYQRLRPKCIVSAKTPLVAYLKLEYY